MDQALPIEATAKTVLFAAVATPPKEKKRKRSRQPKQPKARQPKIKGKKSGFFSFVKWTIAAALVAGPVGSAIWEYFTPYRAAAKDLPKAIAEYKRAGLPWTAAQLDKYANLPDGQNAAMYISASGQVVSALNLDKSNPKVIAALESGDVAEAAKLLELYRPVVGYAMLASKRDHLSFHRNWKAGPSLTFPEESEAAKVVDVIDLYAELEALRGHGQQSATYLRTSLKIGSLVSDEPAMIGALMALGCRVRAWNAASRAATLLARRPQELTAFEKTLKFEPPDIHLRDALRGEEYMGLTIGRNAWMAALMTQSSPSSTHEEPQPTSTEGVPSSVSDQALMDRIIRYWIEVDTILRTNPDPVTAGARMDQMST
ncbi:MAG TPA: hypothetical protein VG944_06350, partial [Fimbriimonas sp.]|nr:hypothetical protein [Fimbriimonas sp.]